ncbi:MAG TPA: hypothetical protein VN380_15530 [Thermoanaerobaculia bacterium]|jgi:anthranilate/para-aminobenzoate synthase component I|nr:hypothetical protein [Thermoanaerobaculia bacterium]
MESCIASRTGVLERPRLAGSAGIVFDPAREYEEAMSKSAALKQAISVAKRVLDRS